MWPRLLTSSLIANAIVISITKQPPFNTVTDQPLGVSFVSIFVVAFVIAFFPCGLCDSIAWDYRPGIPQGKEAEVRAAWSEKPLGAKIHKVLGLRRRSVQHEEERISKHEGADLERNLQNDSETIEPLSESNSEEHTVTSQDRSASQMERKQSHTPQSLRRRMHSGMNYVLHTTILNPGALALIISLPIALVPQLKALFVDASSNGGPNFHGPDGRPPLAFMIDTASSIGGLTVPLGLILLGSSFARFTVPRPLSRLPIFAIVATCLAKMVIIPVIGIFVVQSMTKAGLVDKEDKVERYVAILVSGTPAAVFQVIVAQLHAPDGRTDTLAAFLLAQYVFMFFSTAALSAIALSLL